MNLSHPAFVSDDGLSLQMCCTKYNLNSLGLLDLLASARFTQRQTQTLGECNCDHIFACVSVGGLCASVKGSAHLLMFSNLITRQQPLMQNHACFYRCEFLLCLSLVKHSQCWERDYIFLWCNLVNPVKVPDWWNWTYFWLASELGDKRLDTHTKLYT